VQALIQAGKAGNFVMKDNGQVEIEGETLEVGEYELAFLTEGGLEAEATHQVVVLLDTELTDELQTEGMAREIIRAVQELRKSSGFEVSDRINITCQTDSELIQKALTDFASNITTETLADSLDSGTGEHELTIEDQKVSLSITKA